VGFLQPPPPPPPPCRLPGIHLFFARGIMMAYDILTAKHSSSTFLSLSTLGSIGDPPLSYLSGVNTQKEDHTKHHNDPEGGIHDAPTLPPVKVVVTKGTEDVTIKVCDRGGGMKRSMVKQMWTFAHSTLNEEGRTREDKYDFGKDELLGSHIRGFGLPLARIYARYFGGEVTIKSMEGYGVDAYLYLPVLGDACENLPQRVVHSPGNLDSSPPPSLPAVHGVADDVMILDSYDDGNHVDFFEDSNVRQFDSSSGGPTTTKKKSAVLDTLDERAL
jgi:hypothetical protein